MYPGLAYQKAFNLMVMEAAQFWDLYEDDYFKIGYNVQMPYQILIQVDTKWHPTLQLWEDDKLMKYFWEFEAQHHLNGAHITYRKGDSQIVTFYGYCFAKERYFEFMPVFTLENKGE